MVAEALLSHKNDRVGPLLKHFAELPIDLHPHDVDREARQGLQTVITNQPYRGDPIFIEAPEGLEDIVPQYLAERKLELAILERLLASSGFESIRSRAHDMKGTGASFGFPDVTRIGASLEDSAKNGRTSKLRESLDELAHYLDCVRLKSTPRKPEAM